MSDSVPVRIVVLDPPPGVRFAVQSGKADLLPPTSSSSEAMIFEFSLRLGPRRPDGAPNPMPPFAHGPAHDRFIYVNSGTLAGQAGSPWTRRAKIKTAGIGPGLVDEVVGSATLALEVRIAGTGRDGGPPAGSVPSVGGWQIVRRST